MNLTEQEIVLVDGIRRLGQDIHFLHLESSGQEFVLVDYDEDVAGGRSSLALAWLCNPTFGGILHLLCVHNVHLTIWREDCIVLIHLELEELAKFPEKSAEPS